jgi:prevent-host-death family protein
MKHSESIKPISYIKSHAADVIEKMNIDQKPLIITQNGEAKVILQDLKRYESEQDAIKMLKLLAIGQGEIDKGEIVSSSQAFKNIRKSIKKNNAA